MNYFFVLGAIDPEMMEIVRVLKSLGIGYTFAMAGAEQVRAFEAYQAARVRDPIPTDRRVVFVECRVAGLPRDLVCDHHFPGDPGYGLPPDRYLEGSSLGQVLALLELTPTDEQRAIAAADHCLGHAYAGCCPGVAPVRLAAWRDQARAAQFGVPVAELQARIERAKEALRIAQRIRVADEEVAFFPVNVPAPDELSEAATRLGVPFCYERPEGDRTNTGIMSATPELVAAWLNDRDLSDVYGDPARGFAGGYLASR
jgi:hypothetical protein